MTKASRTDKRTSISPLTLRLTLEERQTLEELAAGMTLSAYIRACVFAEQSKRRKAKPKSVVADKKAATEALALLGQSRIASNLNQLAYHANIGALDVDEAERAQLNEAYEHVLAIRTLLMQALGKTPPSNLKARRRARSDFARAMERSDKNVDVRGPDT